MYFERQDRRDGGSRGPGCFGIPLSGIWLFFTLMYFFTEPGAFPVGKLEFFWRFLAGPFNFLF